MPRKENAEFLVSLLNPLTTFPVSVYDAMLTWLFKSEERTIEVCAAIAYSDIRRKPIEGIGNMPEVDKKAWRAAMAAVIAERIDALLQQQISKQAEFDAWHKATCETMNEISDKYEASKYLKNGYTYGLAQKQLNITFKNMMVMEQWDKQLEKIRNYLHCPVDSYIMEAASVMLDIAIPLKNGDSGKYKEGDSKPWSQWDYNDYIVFQEAIRAAIEMPTVSCPIDWEFGAWNKIKEQRGAK